ncbi:MAG: Bax inhibitor-1/YccA family protein [Gemmatimonadales bacterium]
MANPVLSRTAFTDATALPAEGRMTLAGAVTKTGALMALCAISAAGIWVTSGSLGPSMSTAIMVAALIGFAIAMVTVFKPAWSPVTAPLYAIVEGVLLGGFTLMINATPRYAGLPLTALGLTLLAGFTMLGLYVTRIVRVTQRFRAVIVGATVAIMAYYLLSIVLGLFGVQAPLLQSSSWMSIGFSLLVVGIASMSFLLDFDMIEQAVDRGSPHYLEWYGAFGVLVTFVWLYLEILRLLVKISGRRN